MSMKVYIKQILGLIVKSWLLKKQDFIFKENNNSGYIKGKNYNIIK